MRRGEAFTTAARSRPKPISVCCDECQRKTGTKLSYRLDPKNWHRVERLLCGACRSKLGFALIQYGQAQPRMPGITRWDSR